MVPKQRGTFDFTFLNSCTSRCISSRTRDSVLTTTCGWVRQCPLWPGTTMRFRRPVTRDLTNHSNYSKLCFYIYVRCRIPTGVDHLDRLLISVLVVIRNEFHMPPSWTWLQRVGIEHSLHIIIRPTAQREVHVRIRIMSVVLTLYYLTTSCVQALPISPTEQCTLSSCDDPYNRVFWYHSGKAKSEGILKTEQGWILYGAAWPPFSRARGSLCIQICQNPITGWSMLYAVRKLRWWRCLRQNLWSFGQCDSCRWLTSWRINTRVLLLYLLSSKCLKMLMYFQVGRPPTGFLL